MDRLVPLEIAWIQSDKYCFNFTKLNETFKEDSISDSIDKKEIDLLLSNLTVDFNEFLDVLNFVSKNENLSSPHHREQVSELFDFVNENHELNFEQRQYLLWILLGDHCFEKNCGLGEKDLLELAEDYCFIQLSIYKRCQEFGLEIYEYHCLERLLWKYILCTVAPRTEIDFREFVSKEGPIFDCSLSFEQIEHFYGGFKLLLQIGPHRAILDVKENNTRDFREMDEIEKKLGEFDEVGKLPVKGKSVGSCRFGQIRCIEHNGKKIAIKVVSRVRLHKHERRKHNHIQTFKDDIFNEIMIHRTVCKLEGFGRENIIEFISVSKDKGNIYYYQEYGCDLPQFMSQHYQNYFNQWKQKCRVEERDIEWKSIHPSPWEQRVKRWCISIAEGISFLKKNGVCHRDIKPSNMVLDLDKRKLKIIDFGLARIYGSWERDFKTQEIVGTPKFLSPEAFYHTQPKKAATQCINCETCFWNADANDIWAFGITVFNLMFNCEPFERISTSDSRFRIFSRDSFCCKYDGYKWNLKSIWYLLERGNKHQMVTKDCVNFFHRIFVPQHERATIEELMEHPWLCIE